MQPLSGSGKDVGGDPGPEPERQGFPGRTLRAQVALCPGCVPVSPAEREGLGSASQSRVGVNRRLDGSSYEGCSQGGRGLQGGLRPGHPSWLRSRALAIGHPVPGWGAVLRTLPTTRSQEASRRAKCFLGHSIVQAKHGLGRGLAL